MSVLDAQGTDVNVYTELQQKYSMLYSTATKNTMLHRCSNLTGAGVPSCAGFRRLAQCLIIFLLLFNMMHSVQFRKKGLFCFGFVEADQVFLCFPSDRSSQIFKINIYFYGFVPAAVTVFLSPKAGQHLSGTFGSSDGKLIFLKYLKCVKFI